MGRGRDGRDSQLCSPTGLGSFHLLTIERLCFNSSFIARPRRVEVWFLARDFTDKILREATPVTFENFFKGIVTNRSVAFGSINTSLCFTEHCSQSLC